ncbi:MAG: 5-(carboxyamino)imidazole ribonucleotide mutase [Negativicutes bacterium]|jgi:5-(carboxyamino)imidazole ribonucleotide mutase
MKVAIIIGSESDLPIVKKAATIFKKFGVKYSLRVMSAHRTPDIAAEFAKNAEANGYEVVIAAAGKAAHLPGVLAAFTVLPVIGIPIKAAAFDGMDALLAIVQMPAGIPVATVAVDGAENAALLAVQIMSGKHPQLREQMREYRAAMQQAVIESDERVQREIAN